MAEIEEELSIEVLSENVHFSSSTGKDTITVRPTLSDSDAATMAWLSNHIKGTKLKLELKLDEVQAKQQKK